MPQSNRSFGNGRVMAMYGMQANGFDSTTGKPKYSSVYATGSNFQAIDGSTPVLSQQGYMVQANDSLQAIALASFGDASLWYLIADANHLPANATLQQGQRLIIPSLANGTHNSADTFTVYNPSTVQGPSSPQLSVPQPSRSGGGCGGIGLLLVLVVAVVATVLTAGALAAPAGTSLSGLFSTGMSALGAGTGGALGLTGGALTGAGVAGSGIVAGATSLGLAGFAVAGAVGSIASQLVGMAVGVQDSFSWSQVGLAALGGAIGGGLAGSTPLTGPATSFGNTVARAAIGNALSQGIGVATGMQPHFSWAAVAGAAVGAGVSWGLDFAGGKIDGNGELNAAFRQTSDLNQFVHSSATNMASGLSAAVARGGHISVGSIAADAFGNALGNAFMQRVTQPSQHNDALTYALQTIADAGAPAQGGLLADVHAIAADGARSASDRAAAINDLILSQKSSQLALQLNVALPEVSALPDPSLAQLAGRGDVYRITAAGSDFVADLQAGREQIVGRMRDVLAAHLQGYSERQERLEQTFADEPALNRALIWAGAATDHAWEGAKGVAGLVYGLADAGGRAGMYVGGQIVGIASDLLTGNSLALSKRLNTVINTTDDFLAGASERVATQWEGLKTLASAASDPRIAAMLSQHAVDLVKNTTATGWLFLGANFLGELALSAGAAGKSVSNIAGIGLGTLSSSNGYALDPLGLIDVARRPPALLQGAPNADRALEEFGLLARHYRNFNEAISIARMSIEHGISPGILREAHAFAQAAPLEERSGILYGHIRMRDQGFTRVADFKFGSNNGLDAVYSRTVNGVQEFAVLEAKSGAARASSLATLASGDQQGSAKYIASRLNEYLNKFPGDGPSQQLARQLIESANNQKVGSYASFADFGHNGARLLELPRIGNIGAIANAQLVPWKTARNTY